MNSIANSSSDFREELFLITAKKLSIAGGIIEKDFWVCWLLDYLFHKNPWSKSIAFKGGTSLSKCYGLIERFSEDIDIIMDWCVLGYELNEPYIDRNRTKQDQFNKAMNANTEVFLQSSFMPALEKDISSLLHSDFSLYIDDIDPQTICFAYPKVFTESSILPVIRIEIGALAAWTALQDAVIAPSPMQHSSIPMHSNIRHRTY